MRNSQQGQQALWVLGLSGDWPILLASIDSKGGLPSVRQLLQAHQYWRIKGVTCDLVILNEHPPSYLQELTDAIMATVMASSESGLFDRPGGVFIRRADVLKPDEIALLRAMARVHVVCDGLGLGNLLELPDGPDGEEEYVGRPNYRFRHAMPVVSLDQRRHRYRATFRPRIATVSSTTQANMRSG